PALYPLDAFWQGRPRYGYAAVAKLRQERWLPEPFWGGPRTYGYEWVVLESQKKRASWLEPKPPPRGGEGLFERFTAWRDAPGWARFTLRRAACTCFRVAIGVTSFEDASWKSYPDRAWFSSAGRSPCARTRRSPDASTPPATTGRAAGRAPGTAA